MRSILSTHSSSVQGFELQRNCSSCGHRWFVLKHLCEPTSNYWSVSDEDIDKGWEDKLHKLHAKLISPPRKRIVCPCCANLAAESVKVYFDQGFRKGIRKLWSKCYCIDLLILIALATCGMFFWFVCHLGLNERGTLYDVVDILCLMATATCLLLFVTRLLYAVILLTMDLCVCRWVYRMSEVEAGNLVLAIVKSNNSDFPRDLRRHLLWQYWRRDR